MVVGTRPRLGATRPPAADPRRRSVYRDVSPAQSKMAAAATQAFGPPPTTLPSLLTPYGIRSLDLFLLFYGFCAPCLIISIDRFRRKITPSVLVLIGLVYIVLYL